MKVGVVVVMVVFVSVKLFNLKGDVIFMGVVDEEDVSFGI